MIRHKPGSYLRITWSSLVILTLQLMTCQCIKFYGGIPVPGRRVPVLRYFEYYISQCEPLKSKDISFEEISRVSETMLVLLLQLLKSLVDEEMAEKTLNNMYFSVDDLDVTYLMGKWVTVVDSPFVHREYCPVNYYQMSSQNKYTADFTTIQRARTENGVVAFYGWGRKVGPDPGSVFVSTGNPNDPCPLIPVRVGPVAPGAHQFEYVVLTTPLKTPTVVLARDPARFQSRFRREVEDYLARNQYLNPVLALKQPLHFLNLTNCDTVAHFDYDLGVAE